MKEDLIQTQVQQINQLKAGKPDETTKSASSDNNPFPPLKLIEKQKFRNEKVLLDGYKYVDCIFENVTLVYNGGPSEVINTQVHFNKTVPFETTNRTVKQT